MTLAQRWLDVGDLPAFIAFVVVGSVTLVQRQPDMNFPLPFFICLFSLPRYCNSIYSTV